MERTPLDIHNFVIAVAVTDKDRREFIRKLSNFTFQWTKTLYKNILSHMAFFFTVLKGYKCTKLYEITPKRK